MNNNIHLFPHRVIVQKDKTTLVVINLENSIIEAEINVGIMERRIFLDFDSSDYNVLLDGNKFELLFASSIREIGYVQVLDLNDYTCSFKEQILLSNRINNTNGMIIRGEHIHDLIYRDLLPKSYTHYIDYNSLKTIEVSDFSIRTFNLNDKYNNAIKKPKRQISSIPILSSCWFVDDVLIILTDNNPKNLYWIGFENTYDIKNEKYIKLDFTPFKSSKINCLPSTPNDVLLARHYINLFLPTIIPLVLINLTIDYLRL